MGVTQIVDSKALSGAAPALPVYATIDRWCALSGLSRTRTYVEMRAGNIPWIQYLDRRLVEVAPALGWMRTLPRGEHA